jgi:hypothetical protein
MKQLVRLHRWKLNERRQKLVELEGLAHKMRTEIDRLDETMDAESKAADRSRVAAMAYPAYVSAMLERRKKLSGSIVEIEESIAEAREEVAAGFQELKRYELALQNKERREDLKTRRREQAETDAQGAVIHRRQAMV